MAIEVALNWQVQISPVWQSMVLDGPSQTVCGAAINDDLTLLQADCKWCPNGTVLCSPAPIFPLLKHVIAGTGTMAGPLA